MQNLIYIIAGILIGILVSLVMNRRNEKERSYLIQEYEQKIKDVELKHQQEIKNARSQSVSLSRNTLRGQITEQVAPALDGFKYALSDARFIGSPIDYIIFNGYSQIQDGEKDVDLEIVLLEVKSQKAGLNKMQQRISKAVEQGKVRFETMRVSQNGEIKGKKSETKVSNFLEELNKNTIKPGSKMWESIQKNPRAYKKWELEEDEFLATMYKNGSSVGELSKILQRNRGGVRSRLKKLGITGEKDE